MSSIVLHTAPSSAAFVAADRPTSSAAPEICENASAKLNRSPRRPSLVVNNRRYTVP